MGLLSTDSSGCYNFVCSTTVAGLKLPQLWQRYGRGNCPKKSKLDEKHAYDA
jgi:hypothetical protein